MKTTKKLTALLLACLMMLSPVACNKMQKGTDELWKEATYTEDITLGDGAKVLTVKVTVGERSVVFTLKTDKETLGDALSERGLIEGEQGEFGLYIKKVNGIEADYDKDQTYWGLSKDGADLMTGADGEKISGGESYEFARKK